MPTKLIAGSLLVGALALASAMSPLLAAAPSAAIPDFSGIWVHPGESDFSAIPGDSDGKPIARLEVNSPDAQEIWAGDWSNPILQPWVREIVKKNAESEIRLEHVNQADDACYPMSVPEVLNLREGVQFLQRKDRVVILYQRDHQVRHIYLNQKHTAGFKPSWFGESIGHYEGDTLVVDTIGLKAHPMSAVDNYGTPHTDRLHVVERYRPIIDDKGKGIEVVFRVEDPGAFTMPWKARVVYRPNRDQVISEVVCSENNRGFEGEGFVQIPEEKTPPF